ncbi:hypothetical protein DSM112329_02282 [Paraconexibacter sp. AEG42_29]|uniref:Phage holin family protein n=1 Tax=Paraconexibacter sp. AEG42_29 TaxID=2997339 RepID=A0AAU7AUS2_9ACTN
METGTRPTDTEEASTAQLLGKLPQQVSTLIRDELRLAQLEMREKGKRGGLGAGMMGGAGLAAMYGVGALIATAILLLATAVDAWIAALIVTGVLFVVAGVLALLGKRQLAQAIPPAPEQAIDSSRQDIADIKEAAHR